MYGSHVCNIHYTLYILNLIMITQDPVSKESLGDVFYYPQAGWSYDYYPFGGQQGYKSPLVAVQFMNLSHRKLTSHRDTCYNTTVISMVSWVMWLLVTLTVNLYQSTVLLYPILPDHVTRQVLAMRANESKLSH